MVTRMSSCLCYYCSNISWVNFCVFDWQENLWDINFCHHGGMIDTIVGGFTKYASYCG